MKLFYDMLIPFMPAKRVIDDKTIEDPKLEAARHAMVMLAAFQNEHRLNSLYDAVYQMSIYGDINIVDLLYSLGDVEILSGKVEDILDIEAKNLFKTIVSEDPFSFDYRHFAAVLLSVAHAILTQPEPQEEPINPGTDAPIEESSQA